RPRRNSTSTNRSKSRRGDYSTATSMTVGPGAADRRQETHKQNTRSLPMRPSIRLHAGTRLLACVLVSAAACDGRTPAAADADTVGGSLITAIQAEPRFLLPPLISLIDEQMVGDQIFEPLARMGDDGRLDRDFRPALAD